jgi:hypothetical protein
MNKLLPPPDLHYAQVVKHRQRGRVVEVTTKVVFGSEAAIRARLAASPVSEMINTSFAERNNLTGRQCNGRLSREVLSFFKGLTWKEDQEAGIINTVGLSPGNARWWVWVVQLKEL